MAKLLGTQTFFVLLAFTSVGPLAFGQANLGNSPWEPELKAFAASDLTNPPPQNAILFLGSSSIRKWQTLSADFPEWKVINRGFGGSQIADSVALADRLVFPYHPSVIVFYAGDNDLAAGKSPAQVVADYKTFVKEIHARLPQTRIVFISIKPSPLRIRLKDETISANRQIAALSDPQLAFVDVFTPMLDNKGEPRKELFLADGLHPSRACYQLWASLIKPALNPAR